MRTKFTLAFLLVFSSTLYAQPNQAPTYVPIEKEEITFRNTKWGMSCDEVKATEQGDPIAEKPDMLGYIDTLLGKEVYVVYSFVNNKLVWAKYGLSEAHTNKSDYIDDYQEFREALTKKYGKPKQDAVNWKNDLYKSDRSEWGMAVSIGHLHYQSIWKSESCEIMCDLHGDNYEINCTIQYRSLRLADLVNQEKEKINLEKF